MSRFVLSCSELTYDAIRLYLAFLEVHSVVHYPMVVFERSLAQEVCNSDDYTLDYYVDNCWLVEGLSVVVILPTKKRLFVYCSQ